MGNGEYSALSLSVFPPAALNETEDHKAEAEIARLEVRPNQ